MGDMAAPVALIAEPAASQRQIIDLLLTAGGFDLAFVGDGREALTYLQVNTPDLVISALDLPALDGFELCRKVRAVRRFARTPVILLAADAATAARARDSAAAAGAAFVLAAPLGDKNLVERAHALLKQEAPAIPGPVLPAAVLAPVSGGRADTAGDGAELEQLRQDVARLSQENALLRQQLAAPVRTASGDGSALAELRSQLEQVNGLLAEYRRRHPELELRKARIPRRKR
jgi:CheY-like chemotaxis protein